MARILVIDQDSDQSADLAASLRALNLKVDIAAEIESALTRIEKSGFDLVIVGGAISGSDKISILRSARENGSGTRVVFHGDSNAAELFVAMQAGACAIIDKPRILGELRPFLNGHATNGHKVAGEVVLTQLDGMLAGSRCMQDVFRLIQNAASSEANILISGESGTGKELAARNIHRLSARDAKPFVAINCSAVPEHLFEAELFGYEKGAFTGANARKPGLLEFADKGSFFLDEVCDLPLLLQAKLLRVLQEKKSRRLGGHTLKDLDVRLISASNGNIEAALDSGKMRDDFYYRINVVHIALPPLRERREDIPLLAHHFMQRFSGKMKKPVVDISGEALQRLSAYAWPGNVRELENVLERAIALTLNDIVTVEDLPANIIAATDGENGRKPPTLAEARREVLYKTEMGYLLNLLQKHAGNVTRIADEAGMTRRNIHRLLLRHQLDPQHWRRQKSANGVISGTIGSQTDKS